MLQGAALIALPQFKLPLVAVTGAVHIHKALRRRREQKQAALAVTGDSDPSQTRGAVTLEWDQLDCSIVKKDGSQKQILHSVAGVARAGRWLSSSDGPSRNGLHAFVTPSHGGPQPFMHTVWRVATTLVFCSEGGLWPR